MERLIAGLAQYADYHRDPRNIATHCVGVPMIVLGLVVALSHPLTTVAGWPLSVAPGVALVAVVYYLRLDVRYGLVLGTVLAAMLWLAAQVVTWPAPWSWGTAAGLFVLGWVMQLVGHAWERRKPAFFDDVVGLLMGPLFVVAELGFVLGWRREVAQAVQARSGPLRRRKAVAAP